MSEQSAILGDNPEIIQLVLQFNEALNQRDVDTMMHLMTPDCVFENTYPPPEGTRYHGQAAVRSFWVDFFNGAQVAKIELEDIFSAGNRCVLLWTYRWIDPQGAPGHVRGVDVYRIEDGLIADKLSYVKG